MGWLGQHIWQFITRFRSSVYLEDISDAGSDTDKFLVAESDGKISYRTGAEVLSDIGASSESTDLEFNESTADGILTYGGAAQIDVESFATFANSSNISTLTILSDEDTGDYFSIATTTHGDTTIKTVDDDAIAANITIIPDGKLILNPLATITELGDDTNTAQVIRRMAHGDGMGGAFSLYGGAGGGSNQAGGNLKLYGGAPTGNAAWGEIEFNCGQTGASGTTTRSPSLISKVVGNADTSTDQYWYEKAGASLADYFKLSVAEHGATTMTTLDDGAAGADLTFTVDGKITMTPTDLTGVVFHLDANADTDNTVDIDAGILDIDVGSTATLDAATSWTVTSPEVSFQSSADGKPVVELKTTHTTKTSSAELQFKKDAADTEDGEVLGKITFYGEDEGNNNTQFAEIVASISESDEGDEAGTLELKVAESDSTTTAMTTGLKLEGEHATDGEIDVTIGAGAASLTTIAGNATITSGLTMGSTSFVNSSGVVQVATQGTIDHDSLANFVAAEHYDWSSDISGTATIHANNITDLHGAGVDGAANQMLTDDGDGSVTSEVNLTFTSNPSFSFYSVLEIGSSDGGLSEIIKKAHDNGDGGTLKIAAGDSTNGGATDANGGDMFLYTGRPTGEGNFGSFKFYAGDTETGSGTTLRSSSIIAELKPNGATSTDFILYEKAGTSVDDYLKLSVAEHGATTLTTLDNAAHAANLTLSVDGDILLDNDGLGLTKITSDGVEIENGSSSGAPALLIDNDDADKNAIKIEAANTNTAIIDIDASALTTGSAIWVKDDTYERAAGHINIDVTDTQQSTINRGGAGLLSINYDRPSGSDIAPGETVDAIGASIRMDDNADPNAGNASITGLDIHCDFADNSGAGGVTTTGISTRVGGGDSNVDIKMINDSDDSVYATMACGTGGKLTLATTSDDATGDITLDADGDLELNADDGTILFKDASVNLARITNIGSTTVTGGQINTNRQFAITTNTEGDFDGDVIYTGGTTVVLGKIYYLNDSGGWTIADAGEADSDDAKGLLAVALGTNSTTHGMLLRGMVTLYEPEGTEDFGHTLYLSDTPGVSTITAPTTSGHTVRIIGYSFDDADDQIWFNPDSTYIELA